MKRIKIKEILCVEDLSSFLDKTVKVSGWIRSVRAQKSFAFISLNDGSSFANMQIILDASYPDFDQILTKLTTGSAISCVGVLKESPGKNQSLEMLGKEMTLHGLCASADYPLQKKRHSFEFLRTIAHLRARTNTQGAVARIRNALAFASHLFFQNKDFLYIQTPIITTFDCEGAGEMFHVTTLQKGKPPTCALDFENDFFRKPAYLTVSGQLEAECFACSLSDVYTFGPTFRAENSNTSRHLAEFWMIEPELAFADLHDDLMCAEEYIKFVIQYVLKHCSQDMQFFNQFIEKGLIERLEKVASSKFEIISYTEAISILEKAKQKFEFSVKWGSDLQSEHERFLCEKHFNKPVAIIDYPKEIKAFYMRENDDKKTVAAMDILVPRVGELIGGSQREERLDILSHKMDAMGLDKQVYGWYLELRKYGSVSHSGFGVGFERLIQFITGMENIRDVIAFPRYPGHAEF